MAHIKGGHTDPSVSREARPRASSPQDSSQAPQALTVPSYKDGPDPQALTDSQRPSGIAWKPSSRGLWSSCLPLREIQIVEPCHFIPSFISTLRPCDNNRASGFIWTTLESMTTQGAQSPTTIHFSIDGRQGILEARHISGALHIPYASGSSTFPGVDPYISVGHGPHPIQGDFWRFIPSTISEGFYFGPHHLIMAIFSTLRRRFTRSSYSAPVAAPPRPASPVPPQAEQQDELPVESVPPAPAAPSMPEAISTDPPATPLVPPVAPSTSEASFTISAIEFRVLQHLGLLPPPQIDIPGPSEPIAPVEETIKADARPSHSQGS
ncbi:hypothetical protein CK203_064850, partial [Vitis vinifera]